MWWVVAFFFRRRAYGTLNVRSLLDVREQYLNEFSFPDPYAEVMTQADSSIMNFHLRLSWSDVFSIRIVLSLSHDHHRAVKKNFMFDMCDLYR